MIIVVLLCAAIMVCKSSLMLTLSSCSSHTCAIDNQMVKCWGENTYGQLGYGDTNNRGDQSNEMGANLPMIDLGTNFQASQFALGQDHTCVLSTTGKIKCFGRNNNGQLGYGDTTTRGTSTNEMGNNLAEVQLGANFSVSKIVAGQYHTCALSNVSQIKCWGSNSNGQLGLGDSDSRGYTVYQMGDNLTTVDLGTSWVPNDIALGQSHSCAISTTGKVKCWGSNADGQLGYGDTTNRGNAANQMGSNLPEIDLGTGYNVSNIGLGSRHCCAFLTTNQIKCWGKNNIGQLGAGDTTDRGNAANTMGTNVVAVSLGTNFIPSQLTVGFEHTCVLSTSNKVKCWGWNYYGQLGLGNQVNTGTGSGQMGDNLAQLSLGTNWNATIIYTGRYHSCASAANQSIKCWGLNTNGQLGYGHNNIIGTSTNQMGDSLATIDWKTPTQSPTNAPTINPTSAPTSSPTTMPTQNPTFTSSATQLVGIIQCMLTLFIALLCI